jgi:Mg-chelatase subunit ChlD
MQTDAAVAAHVRWPGVWLVLLVVGAASFGWCAAAAPTTASDAITVALGVIVEHEQLWDLGIGLPEGGRPLSGYSVESVARFVDGSGERVLGYVVALVPVGFIVVSGDTDLRPLVAYSFESDFETEGGARSDTLTDMLAWDLETGLDSLGVAGRGANQHRWSEHLAGAKVSIVGKTQWPVAGSGWLTTTWRQGAPYNASCPLDPVTGDRCIVGCTAVAMGQVVAYWQHPSAVTLSGSYTSSTDPDGAGPEPTRTMTINRADATMATIDWNQGNPLDATTADLLFACGAAIDMNYSDRLSGAWVENVPAALTGPFQFSSAATARPSEPTFYTRLADNMKNGQPAIIHIGQDPAAAEHTVVVDGYNDVDNAFHLNFGWGNTLPDAIADCWYVLPTMTDGYSVVRVAALDIRPPSGVDVVLITDRSGSMSYRATDPTKLEQAQSATSYFVSSSEQGDRIGLVSYQSWGTTDSGLLLIGGDGANATPKPELRAILAGYAAGGNTNYPDPLQLAYDLLSTTGKSQKRIVVMLSDGQPNTPSSDPGEYQAQVDLFRAAGWPVYTIGLGTDVVPAVLEAISRETGGKYYGAAGFDLTSIYDEIISDVKWRSTIATLRGWISLGARILRALPLLPSGLSEARFLLSWSGSELDMNLVSPDGTPITPASAGVAYYEGITNLWYTVPNPAPGQWWIDITGTDVPPEQEEYIAGVTVEGETRVSFTPFKPHYAVGEVVDIGILVENVAGPILEATVGVHVLKPGGARVEFPLFDDGLHGDGAADDGVYGGRFTEADEDGLYEIAADVTGPVSASVVRTIVVGVNEPALCTTQSAVAGDPGWRMISLPGQLCAPCELAGNCGDLVCALDDDLDPFFAYRYDPTVGAYVRVPPADQICYQPGMGIWTYTWEPNTQLDADVTTVAASVAVPLQNGWNQIGNPYTFAMGAGSIRVRCGVQELSLIDAQTQGWISATLYGYDTNAGAYVELDPATGCIPAWTGCWIRTYRADCTLVFQPVGCTSSLTQARPLSTAEARALELPPPPPPPLVPQALDVDEVLAGLSALNVPNPIRSEFTTVFRVEGARADAVDAMRVDIYGQDGQRVFTQEVAAKELAWHTVNDAGELLANGVYLYRVWVKIGEIWYPLEVQKLAVYR